MAASKLLVVLLALIALLWRSGTLAQSEEPLPSEGLGGLSEQIEDIPAESRHYSLKEFLTGAPFPIGRRGFVFLPAVSVRDAFSSEYTVSLWTFLTPDDPLEGSEATPARPWRVLFLKFLTCALYFTPRASDGVPQLRLTVRLIGGDHSRDVQAPSDIVGRWARLDVVVTPTSMRLFVDAQNVLDEPIENALLADDVLYIGRWPNYDPSGSSKALLYRFVIWPRALGASEMAHDMQMHPPPAVPYRPELFHRRVDLADEELANLTAQAEKLLEPEDEDEEPDVGQALRLLRRAAEADQRDAFDLLGDLHLVGTDDGLVRQDIFAAFEYYRRAAERGSVRSQRQLGHMFSAGIGVPRNATAAMEWYALAALGDDTEAELVLAYKHFTGVGVPASSESASIFYISVADKALKEFQTHNHIIENTHLAEGIEFGNSGEQDDYLKLQEFFASNGDAQAQLFLGDQYKFGLRGLPVDYPRAMQYFQAAANGGNVVALNRIGEMLLKGEGVPVDNEKALQYINAAADKNDSLAMNMMGYMYSRGLAVSENHTTAKEWFEKAAQFNLASAHTNLGVLYREGRGTHQNYAKAFEHFFAAHEDDLNSAYYLGHLYLEGKGTVQSFTHGLKQLRRVAEFGSWGRVLRKGLSCYIADRPTCALVHYLRAAEMGYVAAQRNAAWLMDLGHCLPNDSSDDCDRRALYYYEQAHRQGTSDDDVALKIGDYYYEGRGTDAPNYSLAFKYYSEMANKHYSIGSYNLAYMYEHGIGVSRNLTLAKHHYEIVSASDHLGGVLAAYLALLNFRLRYEILPRLPLVGQFFIDEFAIAVGVPTSALETNRSESDDDQIQPAQEVQQQQQQQQQTESSLLKLGLAGLWSEDALLAVLLVALSLFWWLKSRRHRVAAATRAVE